MHLSTFVRFDSARPLTLPLAMFSLPLRIHTNIHPNDIDSFRSFWNSEPVPAKESALRVINNMYTQQLSQSTYRSVTPSLDDA